MFSSPKYAVIGELGRGGTGLVYKVRHVTLETVLAVKVLSPELAGDPDFATRFEREARVMARLTHRNIVRVLDIDAHAGVRFIVMEHVEGANLEQLLRQRGRLPLAEALAIAAQVARALVYAHAAAGVIHRDIKPSNIIIEAASGRAVVTDFGIAKLAGQGDQTRSSSFLGTLRYCAPEQARGEPVDGRVDVYGLGLVLYEMLNGVAVYGKLTGRQVLARLIAPEETPLHFADDCPADVRALITRAAARSREQRFPTAAACLAEIERVRRQAPAPSATTEVDLARGDPTAADAETVIMGAERAERRAARGDVGTAAVATADSDVTGRAAAATAGSDGAGRAAAPTANSDAIGRTAAADDGDDAWVFGGEGEKAENRLEDAPVARVDEPTRAASTVAARDVGLGRTRGREARIAAGVILPLLALGALWLAREHPASERAPAVPVRDAAAERALVALRSDTARHPAEDTPPAREEAGGVAVPPAVEDARVGGVAVAPGVEDAHARGAPVAPAMEGARAGGAAPVVEGARDAAAALAPGASGTGERAPRPSPAALVPFTLARVEPAKAPVRPAAGQPVTFAIAPVGAAPGEVRYTWTVDGDPAAGGSAERELDALTPGRHRVRVEAADSAGRTIAHTWEVEWPQPPKAAPPRIDAVSPVARQLEVKPGEAVEFRAAAVDADGAALPVSWIVDGRPSGQRPTFRYQAPAGPRAGTHTVAAEAVGGSGQRERISWRLTVAPAPQPPRLVRVTPDREAVTLTAGQARLFTIDAEIPGADDPLVGLTFEWRLDGTVQAGSGDRFELRVAEPGEHRLAAIVRAPSGADAHREWQVKVAAPSAEPPPVTAAPGPAEVDIVELTDTPTRDKRSLVVEGQLRNRGAHPIERLVVLVQALNDAGNVVAEEDGVPAPQPLPAGELAFFRLRMANDKAIRGFRVQAFPR